MPNYGDVKYWNNRYENDFPEPFDWLFAYCDVKNMISTLFEKNKDMLIVGCGNADFSKDM